MIKAVDADFFFGPLSRNGLFFPLSGQIELTYSCNLDCVHCYCKGSEDKSGELTCGEWKKIINEIVKEGCVFLGISGGESLIRADFLELYSYAKQKGLIITVFTNGQSASSVILDHFVKSPPFAIELTLNGITRNTYESISGVRGSFLRVMKNIRRIKERGLPLILKANCLRQNMHEIARIKIFADKLLGARKNRFYFKYDPMIYPRINRDRTPLDYRLTFGELWRLRKQDPDIWREYQKRLDADSPDLTRDKKFLYRCNAWMKHFFINPYGRLKFCNLSQKYSIDLKNTPFKQGFYRVFPRLLQEKFKGDSRCRDCRLRAICHYCPARAYLETGNQEGPVPYYCHLAKETAKRMGNARTAPR